MYFTLKYGYRTRMSSYLLLLYAPVEPDKLLKVESGVAVSVVDTDQSFRVFLAKAQLFMQYLVRFLEADVSVTVDVILVECSFDVIHAAVTYTRATAASCYICVWLSAKI